jgi:hypothetical protein
MSIQAGDLKRIAERVLDMLGVTDYSKLQVIYALKTEGKWKVSFMYEFYRSSIRKICSFVTDVESGEIQGMWLDRSWK